MDVKDIIYLNQTDFDTLANGGIVTKDGVSYSYDDGNVYAVESDLQEKLISGTNIKTINSQSLLGSGNIVIQGGGGGDGVWGLITGNLEDQTDLQTALNGKQPSLVSGTNIKTINNQSLLGSGDIGGLATETWVTGRGYITGINSGDVTTALGFTPYNSTNPSGFQTSSNVDSKISTHDSSTSAHSSLFNAKQDEITDLNDIRAGAELGSTAVQPSAVSDILKYSAQSLTTEQKLQARTNIGAIDSSAVTNMEVTTNKVTSLSSSSTDTQYPSAKATYDGLTDIRSVAEGKTKSFVINAKTDITGTESSSGDFTNVTAITGVTLSTLKIGDVILIKAVEVPDYWVSQITPSVSLNRMETTKIDLNNYVTKANPETSGLLVHEGNGPGSTGNVIKIRSNNGHLLGYGDASSAFHFGGNAPIYMDNILFLGNGLTFQAFGQTVNLNGGTLVGAGAIEVTSGTVNRVVSTANFGAFPQPDKQNFVVKNYDITGGWNNNWSYQAFTWNTETEEFDRSFGVKADGTIISKGNQVATLSDIQDAIGNAIGGQY